MISEGRQRALVALAVAVSIAFIVLAHAAMTRGVPPSIGAVLSLVPLAIVLYIVLRRAGHRLAIGIGLALAGLAIWFGWDELEKHFPDLLFVEHAGMNLALAFFFGRTLVGGREALVTRFARIVHEGRLPPGVADYTRAVTVAWTVFFATLFAVSAGLYSGGFTTAWSFLATILSPILITAMFLVEYAVRRRALPDQEHVGILTGVRAFMNHVRTARAEAPR